MMGFGVIFLSLLGGYFFCKYFTYTKYFVNQDTGYNLFFTSITYGIIFSVVSCGIVDRLDGIGVNLSSDRVILFTEKEVAVIVLSIALGIVIGKLFNQIGNLFEINLEKKAIRNFGNWLDQLILESMERAIMIEVTLDNGKVYIGKVIELDFLRFDRQFIQIALVYSGYRNNQQDIELVLDYRSYHRTMILRRAAGVKGLPRGISEKDFVVTVSVSSLSSARLFDHDVYHKFKTFGRIG